MKKRTVRLLACAALLASAAATPALGQHAFGIGARRHCDHDAFEDLPFEDGDWSYAAVYEYSDQSAMWQIVFDWAPYVTGTNSVDQVITPQLNLIFKDRAFRGGIGILGSYIDDEDPDWTDIYYQFLLGLELPLHRRFSVELYAVYAFEAFDELQDFVWGDIEFSGVIKYAF
jgi:hypothetical protein